MPKFYSPLRYPGGKKCIFPFMKAFLAENHLINCSYAEPFAGGAGLALQLLMEGWVKEIFINDLDPAIFAIWDNLINNTDAFCEWIKNVNVNLETWQFYHERYKNPTSNSFELAIATFFLNRTNISGIIKGGPIGGAEQSSKDNLDARFNKSDLINRIRKISEFKNHIFISHLDGIDFINDLKSKKRKIFLYIDPPYVKKGAQLYMNFFTPNNHIELSKCIRKLKKPWLLSYDHNKFIIDLYNKNQKVIYNLSQCTSNKTDKEILIFSNKLTFHDSIKALKNPVKI